MILLIKIPPREVVMTKKQFDQAVQEVLFIMIIMIAIMIIIMVNSAIMIMVIMISWQVNGPVKPVGQAAIKFMYTDWMNPRSTNSNMVIITIIGIGIIIITRITITIAIIVSQP